MDGWMPIHPYVTLYKSHFSKNPMGILLDQFYFIPCGTKPSQASSIGIDLVSRKGCLSCTDLKSVSQPPDNWHLRSNSWGIFTGPFSVSLAMAKYIIFPSFNWIMLNSVILLDNWIIMQVEVPEEGLGEWVDVLGSVPNEGGVHNQDLVVQVHLLDLHLQVKANVSHGFYHFLPTSLVSVIYVHVFVSVKGQRKDTCTYRGWYKRGHLWSKPLVLLPRGSPKLVRPMLSFLLKFKWSTPFSLQFAFHPWQI